MMEFNLRLNYRDIKRRILKWIRQSFTKEVTWKSSNNIKMRLGNSELSCTWMKNCWKCKSNRQRSDLKKILSHSLGEAWRKYRAMDRSLARKSFRGKTPTEDKKLTRIGEEMIWNNSCKEILHEEILLLSQMQLYVGEKIYNALVNNNYRNPVITFDLILFKASGHCALTLG